MSQVQSDQNKSLEAIARFPDMNPGPVLQLDTASNVLLANRAAIEIFGDVSDGVSWTSLCPKVDSEIWSEIVASDQPIIVEERIGGREYAFAHCVDSITEIIFVFGADITELKSSQRMLQEIARFPDMNPGPVLRLSQNGQVLMANRAATQIFGEKVVGSAWGALCPELTEDTWVSILDSNEPVPVESTTNECDFVFAHQNDPESELVFVFGSDITELNEAQQTLREVARFPDMNPGPVLRLDKDAAVLISNKAAKGVFGSGLDGSCWIDMCPSMSWPRWDELVSNDELLMVDAKVEKDDYLFTHRFDLVSSLVFVYGTNVTEQRRLEEELRQTEKMAALGKLSAGLAHELNNPAAAASRAADQIHQAMEQLQAATTALSQIGLEQANWVSIKDWEAEIQGREMPSSSFSALEQSDREDEIMTWLESISFPEPWEVASVFAGAGVALADLQNLAGAIPQDALNAVLIKECRLLTGLDLADVLASSAQSISTLVGAVKSYSYMDRAPIQNADIHKGLEDTITILNHKLKKGIQIVRDYDSTIPSMEINGSELNQVWTNLIDNAADAMEQSGTLTIKTRKTSDRVVVEIGDDGPGIDDDVMTRIFEPFYTTKDVGSGTGLGLDVARRIIDERSDGKIGVRSKPGETVFRVELPLAPATPNRADGNPG